MPIKQVALFLLFTTLTLHCTSNVDPFFSKRTISNSQAPSIAPALPRPPAQPAPVKPQTVRPPAEPAPAKPQQTKPKNLTRAITTAVVPSAVVIAAWYTDTRLYYIGAGIIGLSAAACVLYWWYNQSDQNVTEPTITPISVIAPAPDDAKILFHACLRDNVQRVQFVLDRNPSLIEALNHEGVTPLIAASANGSYKVVIELLNRNALIDAAVHNGTTALKVAAAHGHVAIVKELIKRGASMESTAQTPFSALMVAVWHGQLEVVKVLLESGADPHTQVSFSALDIAQRLMQTDLTPRELEVYSAIMQELNGNH